MILDLRTFLILKTIQTLDGVIMAECTEENIRKRGEHHKSSRTMNSMKSSESKL